MSMKLELVLNINSGVVVPRTPATDENPVIFRRIDFETGKAINDKKVNVFEVIEAIEKQERSAPDFNWREYDKKRRAAEKLLNVSKRDMTPVSDDPNEAEEKAKADNAEVVTLKDLGLLNGKKAKSKESKEDPKQESEKITAGTLNI